MNKILIKNGKVLLLKNEDIVIENKDILIENGKIVKIERNIQDNADKVIDAQNHIVMPGLINTHAHIPMSIFRETTEGCKLYEWLNDKIWPIEDKLTREDIYWASMLSYIEMISTGTTCVNDQYFMPEQIREAAVNTGVRAVITRPIVDMGGDLQTRINEFRELYESEESILEHLDNLIELIENLTYALDHKKGKKLQPVQYWLLHWCYATLFKHQTALEKQIIAENRIPSKSKALLSVYKPYFDNAYPALKKYYQICLELKFDQAMELHNKLNSFLGSQYYETTHSFAVTSQKTEPEIFVSNGIGYPYYENTTNLFYRITETGLGLEKGNSFYEVLDPGFGSDLSEEEQAILTYVYRLFRIDNVGYDLHFEDGGFINKYTYLFSDDFLKEAQERYKDIMPWTLKNIIETRANEIYSHMYRHYIKHRNFDSYSLPNIVRTVEPLKYSK